MLFIKIFIESVVQAIRQLLGNKLRTILSLFGISIGIWCIVSVWSAVDSMEYSLLSSFDKLGSNVVYLSKQPWSEDPGQNYWKYLRRPEPDYQDFKILQKKLKSAEACSYSAFMAAKPVQYRSSSIDNAYLIGITQDYNRIIDFEFEKGRYFLPNETKMGGNQVILGHEIAEGLFGSLINPVGKKVKLLGRKMQVIGVIKAEGESPFKVANFDEVILLPYRTANQLIKLDKRPGASIGLRAAAGVSLDQLKDEATGVLRAHRRLKPKQKDNFALNEMSLITNMLGSIFGVMNGVGFVIGGFSLLVGAFGVANIMFVSVKERTSLIGIKKALGAKQYVILLEFLIESIILCLIGGGIGLFFVYLMAQAASSGAGFDIFLSLNNIIWGLVISSIIGIVAGVIPAWIASRMDAVVAMRQ